MDLGKARLEVQVDAAGARSGVNDAVRAFDIMRRKGEEAVAAAVAKFQTLAEQNATDVVVEEWGKRRLAYAIDYKTEGYYVLMSFTSGPDFPKELDRILGITEGIMRSMIVCKGE